MSMFKTTALHFFCRISNLIEVPLVERGMIYTYASYNPNIKRIIWYVWATLCWGEKIISSNKLMFSWEGWHFQSFYFALFPTTKATVIFSPLSIDMQAITRHRIDALRSAAVFPTFSHEFYGRKCLFCFIFHCNSNAGNYRLRVSIAPCNGLIPHMLLTQFNDECSFWFSNDIAWSTNGAAKSPKAKATYDLVNMYNF